MQTKLLEDVVSEIAGKSGKDILQLLIGKKDVNEFLIAKKLALTINQVRNILYKLSNFSLVTFTRKKDKRKGWYTYFWTINTKKALELLEKKSKKEIETLKSQLKSREVKRFYLCKVCKTEVSEETALLHDFTCPECGDIYDLVDNKKIINELKNNISRLEKQKQTVLQELDKIKEIEDKKRARETKKEEKKKAEERKARRKKLKKEREKPEKKLKKKKSKKQSVKKIKRIVKKAIKKKKAVKKTSKKKSGKKKLGKKKSKKK